MKEITKQEKNEVIKAMANILDNQSNISKEIRSEVYKLLGLNTQSEQLSEFVAECLERFSFNSEEILFLEQLRMTVTEEINRIDLQRKNNEQVNYETFQNGLTEKLKASQTPMINLDDDLRNLANNIVDRFPLINVSRDQLYNHFMSKKEQIVKMINQHNIDIVEALIKITPQLAKDLESQTITNGNAQANTINSQPVQQPQQVVKQSVNYLSINDFHSKCIDKLAEVHRMFKNGGNDKSEIAKVYRQLKSFIDSLSNRVYAEKLLEKYEKVSDYAISMIYDQIMFENVPMLKEVFEKHKDLLNDDNIRKPNEPTSPNSPSPIETYVGANSEEIRGLIDKGNYYSILQGLSKEDAAKYAGFINSGYQIIINDYLARASQAKTFEERHNSYFELYEIYQNFRDYLPLEQANQLKEQLDSMQSYLNEQRKTNIDDAGVRYNTERKEEVSARHM